MTAFAHIQIFTLSILATVAVLTTLCVAQLPASVPNAVGVQVTLYTSATCDPGTLIGQSFIPGPFTTATCSNILDGDQAGYSLTCNSDATKTEYQYSLWMPSGCEADIIAMQSISNGTTNACVPFSLSSNGVSYAG